MIAIRELGVQRKQPTFLKSHGAADVLLLVTLSEDALKKWFVTKELFLIQPLVYVIYVPQTVIAPIIVLSWYMKKAAPIFQASVLLVMTLLLSFQQVPHSVRATRTVK